MSFNRKIPPAIVKYSIRKLVVFQSTERERETKTVHLQLVYNIENRGRQYFVPIEKIQINIKYVYVISFYLYNDIESIYIFYIINLDSENTFLFYYH